MFSSTVGVLFLERKKSLVKERSWSAWSECGQRAAWRGVFFGRISVRRRALGAASMYHFVQVKRRFLRYIVALSGSMTQCIA